MASLWFWKNCRNWRKTRRFNIWRDFSSYNLGDIVNVDETGIYADSPPRHYWVERGCGNARVTEMKHHSARMTATLGIRADGKDTHCYSVLRPISLTLVLTYAHMLACRPKAINTVNFARSWAWTHPQAWAARASTHSVIALVPTSALLYSCVLTRTTMLHVGPLLYYTSHDVFWVFGCVIFDLHMTAIGIKCSANLMHSEESVSVLSTMFARYQRRCGS